MDHATKMSEIKYQGKIDLTVENNSHTMAFNYINELADGAQLSVLEVGCSSGYFGAAVRSKGHTVWGVEPDVASANNAEKVLDYVFNGSVEEFSIAHPDKKFDVVVFGDVLEHLADPKQVLLDCHDLLVEGGAVIASVPNVAHVVVRAMLLESHWDYAELGIMDKTHLRFFTNKTIQSLFYDANYLVADIQAVTLPPEVALTACEMQVSDKALAQAEAFANDVHKHDFQYVLCCVPFNAKSGIGYNHIQKKSPIRVLGLANVVETSHAQVRMIDPLTAWANHCNGAVKFKSFSDWKEEDIAWADIVMIQRHIDISTLNVLMTAKKLRKRIIYETDDYLLELPEHLLHHSAGLIAYSEIIDFLLPEVDCITVTTNRLAKRFEHFGTTIEEIPNGVVCKNLSPINPDTFKPSVATLIVASTDKILVGFLLPAIKLLLSDSTLEIEVLVIGPPGDSFKKEGIKITSVPNMPYADFKAFIRTIDNPIGVIPLEDSLFSSCKTAIKFFDYSMAGIPVICSNVAPYSDVITKDIHALLSDNETEEWVSNIKRLVGNIQLRKELVTNATSLIEEHYSRSNVVRRYDQVLKSVLNDGYFPFKEVSKNFFWFVVGNKIKYYKAHILNRRSYVQLVKLFRRDGLKAVLRRIRI